MAARVSHRLPCVVFLLVIAQAEWVVRHSGLPSYSNKPPEAFSINLRWNDDKGKTTNATLNLVKSGAVGRHIPLVANDENGRPRPTRLFKVKNTTLYKDLKAHATIFLTNFKGQHFLMKGSFRHGTSKYIIEPYHPKIHKRSIDAAEDDHIITEHVDDPHVGDADYILPAPGTNEYNRMKKAQENGKRRKRQTVPDTIPQ